MVFSEDAQRRMDLLKLHGDLRDAYVELLSAQFAVNRVRTRYSPETVAQNGSAFVLLRSISAAESICQFFAGIQKSLPPQAGPCPTPTEKADEERD